MTASADTLSEPMLPQLSIPYGAHENAQQQEEEEAMEMEKTNQNPPQTTNATTKTILIAINCIIMILGTTGGPLVSRLYFNNGGKRQWLSCFLETAGFPIILIPLAVLFFRRRRGAHPHAPLFYISPRVALSCAVLGVMTGIDDFLYAYGLSFLPVSTSALLISTQLAFTAFFAYLIVKQRFTPYSVNSVALLTVGAVVLGLHASSDRPEGTSKKEYFTGFFLTLGAAALYGLVLPLVELTYAKAKMEITYTLVMEMQLVIAFFATAFCTVGMIVNKDFPAIPREAAEFVLGETKYYLVLVFCAILWQFFFLGAVGVIFCVNSLLAGIIIAVFIPVTEVLGVIFFHEKFNSEKGVALALSLWGLASYSYGEYLELKEKKKENEAIVLGERSPV